MQTENIRQCIYEFEEKIKKNADFGTRMIESASIATCDLNIDEIQLIEMWIHISEVLTSDQALK